MKSSQFWVIATIILSFSLQSNVRHKSHETKRLGRHKCPLSAIKGDREEENRQDNLERLCLLDSFQDLCFPASCSESFCVPSCCHLISSSHLVARRQFPAKTQRCATFDSCSLLEDVKIFFKNLSSPLGVHPVLCWGTQLPAYTAS